MEEKEINWIDEATAVINDVKLFIKDIHISSHQPDPGRLVLINLETFENEKFCIQLCEHGFGVVSRNFDTVSNDEVDKWYETPYAMLSVLSTSYIERFNQQLMDKLNGLKNSNENEF